MLATSAADRARASRPPACGVDRGAGGRNGLCRLLSQASLAISAVIIYGERVMHHRYPRHEAQAGLFAINQGVVCKEQQASMQAAREGPDCPLLAAPAILAALHSQN